MKVKDIPNEEWIDIVLAIVERNLDIAEEDQDEKWAGFWNEIESLLELSISIMGEEVRRNLEEDICEPLLMYLISYPITIAASMATSDEVKEELKRMSETDPTSKPSLEELAKLCEKLDDKLDNLNYLIYNASIQPIRDWFKDLHGIDITTLPFKDCKVALQKDIPKMNWGKKRGIERIISYVTI